MYKKQTTKRNTKERALELAKRAVRQLSRLGTQFNGIAANINRRTGQPHFNLRSNARNLKHISIRN